MKDQKHTKIWFIIIFADYTALNANIWTMTGRVIGFVLFIAVIHVCTGTYFWLNNLFWTSTFSKVSLKKKSYGSNEMGWTLDICESFNTMLINCVYSLILCKFMWFYFKWDLTVSISNAQYVTWRNDHEVIFVHCIPHLSYSANATLVLTEKHYLGMLA